MDLTFTGVPGATVTYQVDGGSSNTVNLDPVTGQGSITVLGDGTHLITASDTGNQISQVVQIDTTPPTIKSSISAPQSGNGWTSGGTTLTVTASDMGSGVASVTYQVAGGQPTAVTGPISVPSGQTTYTLRATDFVGNSSTATVTTQVDTTAPSVSCTGPDSNWHATDQSVTCTGTDTQSGIVGGTSSTGSVVLSTSVPAGTSTASVSTAAGQICDNVGNCTPIPPISGFMIDKAPPVISCPTADANWHTGTVSFTCTASDTGSGLANSAQASITLTSLPVAQGSGNGNDSTNSVQVCDKVGNCATAGPITGIKIDNSAPTVTMSNPTNNAVYTLNQPETATFSCANAVSGIASCTAVSGTTNVTNGGALPTTAVGTHTIKVTATSKAGQTTTLTYTYEVTYKLCNVVGPVEPLGAAVLWSVTLCNYSGANVGASSIALTSLNVDGTKAPKPVLGNTWIWTPGLKVYSYAMLSSGLTKGSHVLNVSVTGDPVTHALSFTLK